VYCSICRRYYLNIGAIRRDNKELGTYMGIASKSNT
jgi:hypothetical protein